MLLLQSVAESPQVGGLQGESLRLIYWGLLVNKIQVV